MENVVAELFTDPGNSAVVRLPNRRYPGVLIQGDTLKTLFLLADDVLKEARVQCPAGIVENLLELRERVAEMVVGYERALQSHGVEFPYPPTRVELEPIKDG